MACSSAVCLRLQHTRPALLRCLAFCLLYLARPRSLMGAHLGLHSLAGLVRSMFFLTGMRTLCCLSIALGLHSAVSSRAAEGGWHRGGVRRFAFSDVMAPLCCTLQPLRRIQYRLTLAQHGAC